MDSQALYISTDRPPAESPGWVGHGLHENVAGNAPSSLVVFPLPHGLVRVVDIMFWWSFRWSFWIYRSFESMCQTCFRSLEFTVSDSGDGFTSITIKKMPKFERNWTLVPNGSKLLLPSRRTSWQPVSTVLHPCVDHQDLIRSACKALVFKQIYCNQLHINMDWSKYPKKSSFLLVKSAFCLINHFVG